MLVQCDLDLDLSYINRNESISPIFYDIEPQIWNEETATISVSL